MGKAAASISTDVTCQPLARKALPMEPVPLNSSSRWGIPLLLMGVNMYLGVRVDGRALRAVGALSVVVCYLRLEALSDARQQESVDQRHDQPCSDGFLYRRHVLRREDIDGPRHPYVSDLFNQ